jgi:hypothetical protein
MRRSSRASSWHCTIRLLVRSRDEPSGSSTTRRNADTSAFRFRSSRPRCSRKTSASSSRTTLGTFDEAFKSRIQLALHYPPLGEEQRRTIWEAFILEVVIRENLAFPLCVLTSGGDGIPNLPTIQFLPSMRRSSRASSWRCTIRLLVRSRDEPSGRLLSSVFHFAY